LLIVDVKEKKAIGLIEMEEISVEIDADGKHVSNRKERAQGTIDAIQAVLKKAKATRKEIENIAFEKIEPLDGQMEKTHKVMRLSDYLSATNTQAKSEDN
jgi:hypothetical protein